MTRRPRRNNDPQLPLDSESAPPSPNQNREKPGSGEVVVAVPQPTPLTSIRSRFDALKNPDLKSRLVWLVRDLLAILVWSYILVKLLIFDLDRYLLQTFWPDATWLLNFKFFIFAGVIGGSSLAF
jgi:hypothetical protein